MISNNEEELNQKLNKSLDEIINDKDGKRTDGLNSDEIV